MQAHRCYYPCTTDPATGPRRWAQEMEKLYQGVSTAGALRVVLPGNASEMACSVLFWVEVDVR